MIGSPLATLPVRVPAWLRTKAVALALATLFTALLVVACGNTGVGAVDGRKCADKIAQATMTNAPVPGLWNCLDTSLQNKIKATGAVANSTFDGALSIGVASSTRFLGINNDLAAYELTLLPGYAQQAGTKWVELTVWLDQSGKVDNAGIASPAFS